MNIEEIEHFVEMAGMGFATKNEIIDKLDLVNAEQESLDERKNEIRQEAFHMSAAEDGNANLFILLNTDSIDDMPDDYKEKYLQLKELQGKFEDCKDKLEKILESYKNFNKARCFSNIRALLKKNDDVKIGQIEREANVRLGYMSRLEKPDNTSEPSPEFIASAAKMLNVTVDFLMNARMDEMTPTEEYVIKFVETIIKDTAAEKLCWNREPAKTLNVSYELWDNNYPMHPLFAPDEDSVDNNGRPSIAVFFSRFFPEFRVEVTSNVYNTVLLGTNTSIYIVPCNIYDEESTTERSSYEVYLVDNNDVIPLCSTLKTCEAVSDALKNLYSRIQNASSHVQLTSKARNVMDAYMNRTSDKATKNDEERSVLDFGDAKFLYD